MFEDITLDFIIQRYNYWMVIILMMIGLYIVVSRGNLVKKVIGLNLFQTAVFMLYISIGKVIGGTAPIYTDNPDEVYSNPLPHVLILTAIVVGVATMAVGMALIVRIRERYGTIEEDEIAEIEEKLDRQEAA
ncbi:cation:proton antiporter subunit C [Tepidicaulis sp. LMO-SS28]|uniref:cation:proton antiporter subunit C n=1 Tax=Tepidicaulis sp. LMO-SS28 TaxID=3447455 RepID=UPI003EE2AF24